MDEHRLGLKPILRREWVDEFSNATAVVNWRFQWLWLYGFVHPSTGETYWWILPFVNSQLFKRVLEDFARHWKVGPKKRVVLVVDGAGWHLSESVKIPDGIHLYCLPSHSPELQPAERLWPLTNEPIANRCFKNLDELEAVLFERCRKLLNLKQLISGLTHFYWWPEAKV
jgi:transposase